MGWMGWVGWMGWMGGGLGSLIFVFLSHIHATYVFHFIDNLNLPWQKLQMNIFVKQPVYQKEFTSSNGLILTISKARYMEYDGSQNGKHTTETAFCLKGEIEKEGKKILATIQVKFRDNEALTQAIEKMDKVQTLQRFYSPPQDIYLYLAVNLIFGLRQHAESNSWKCFIRAEENNQILEGEFPATNFQDILQTARYGP
jgi:hypothetical protein